MGKARPQRQSNEKQRLPTSRAQRANAPSTETHAAFRWPLIWVSLGLVAANLLVYAAVRRHEFVYFDDQYYVIDNVSVAAGLTWHGVVWAFTTGHASNWHPLTWLSHMLDVQLYGMQAGGHLLTNVVLHIANTLLLFGVLYRMTGAIGRSGFVAALFAVHPLHVESVAWVAERKDVLSTLFWMLTLWTYVSYVRQPQWHRYMLVLVCFALGLLAKPMLVTLPFVLLLLDYWPLGRVTLAAAPEPHRVVTRSSHRSVWLGLLREKLPLFALAVASSVVTFVVQRHGGSVIGLDLAPFGLRAENALVSYVAYIGKMVWPSQLAAFYPYPPSIPTWQMIGAALFLIAGFVVTLWAVRRYPYLLVGWLWYVGTLVPVIGLVQVGFQRMADRYTYIPLIGLFLIVAWGGSNLLRQWRHRRNALAAAAGIVVIACAVTAREQVRTWENAMTLWQWDLKVTSGNFHAHKNLADALASRGKFDEAIPHYLEAVRLRPRYAEAHLRAGHVLSRTGRMNEAMAHYLDALSIRPDLEEAHNGLGVGLMEQRKESEAIAHFMEAARLKPGYADAHHNLALALAKQGRRDEAIREMSKAVQMEPNEATWHYHLAALYQWRGDIEQARHHLERAVTLDPTDQVARRALRDLNVRSPQ